MKLNKWYIIVIAVCLFGAIFSFGLVVGLFINVSPNWGIPPDFDFLNDYPVYRTGESWERQQIRESARQEIGRLIVMESIELSPYSCCCSWR